MTELAAHRAQPSLRGVFDEVRLLCQDNDDPAAVVAAVDRLLCAEEASGEDGASDARAGGAAGDAPLSKHIATFVLNVSMQHLSVRSVLLVHLLRLPDPLPYIEVVPSLFSVAVAPDMVQKVAQQLQQLLQRDPQLLLPVIGALVELPLPRSLAPQLARLAEVALAMADEGDLPMLVRTLLKSLALLPEKHVVQSIRREARGLSEGALALVVDAMWEALPASERAGAAFLDRVAAEAAPGLGLSSDPALSDVAVVLILSSDDVGALRSQARSLLSAWLQMQAFPFAHLERILLLRRSNEVWDRMVPGVWRACMWLLAALAATDVTASVGAARSAYTAAQLGLQRLVLCLYRSVPSMQEPVLALLLGRCFANSSAAHAPPLQSAAKSASLPSRADKRRRGASVLLLPPLGYGTQHEGMHRDCQGKAFPRHPEHPHAKTQTAWQGHGMALQSGLTKEMQQEQRQAVLAAGVLGAVVAAHAEAGGAVLASLAHRLQPQSDGRVLLPVPAVLCPLLACVAASSAASPQTESTLLITVQKLVASASPPAAELAALLGAPLAAWSAAPHSHALHAPALGQCVYTQRAVGLLLAGSFLRRGGGKAPLPQDRRAVLQWVAQGFSAGGGIEDDCLVYALDIFACCLAPTDPPQASDGGGGATDPWVRQLVHACLERVKRSFQLCFCLQSDGAVPEHALAGEGGRQLQRCLVSLPTSLSAAKAGAAVKEGAVVWNLARLAGSLVAVECDPSLVPKLVSAAFWSVQRAAAVASLGTEVALLLSSHPRLDLTPAELAQQSAGRHRGGASLSLPLPLPPPAVAAVRLWEWPRAAQGSQGGDSDAFAASQKRPTDIAAAAALQLAWERAFAAAVLLGQSQALERETAEQEGGVTPAHALQLTARLLAQLHTSRRALRWAQAGAEGGGSGAAVRGRPPSKARGSDVQEERSSAVDAAQRTALQRLLDRCSAMLGLPLLLDALQELLTDSRAASMPPKLLTSAGLAVVGAFALRVLTEPPEESLEQQLAPGSFPPAPSFSSFSSPSSSAATGTEAALRSPVLLVAADSHILLQEMSPRSEHALTVSKKHALLGQLLALSPALARLTEKQRRSGQLLQQDKEEIAADAVLGPALDKRGSSLMLLIVLLLLETHVQSAQTVCAGDVIDFAADPLLNRVALALTLPTVATSAGQAGAAADVLEMEETAGARRMVQLYTALETAVRPLQDCTLAAAGLRALATISRGTRLTLRVSRLAWELLGALYTTHTDVSAGLLRGEGASGPVAPRVLGLDAMWPHVAGHTRRQPFGKFALAEMAPFGRVGRAAGLLLCWAFAPATSSGIAGLPASLALRQLAATWWVHEAPTRRLGGLTCLLLQTLGGMFSPAEPPGSYSFPGLSEASAEQHATTALALLPALLFLARPVEGASDPYAALVGAAKLFVWTLRELQAIADEGDPTGLHERLLPLTVRVCRAQLEAADAAAVRAAHWRSTQPRRSSPAAVGGTAEVDSGAVSHLRRVLQWTYAVSQWVLRHAHAIQARSLAAKSGTAHGAHKGLARSVPQLSLQGERVASRMHRLARTHGLDVLEEPDVLSTSVWEDSLRDAERSFRQVHDAALQAGSAPRADSWQALDARDRDAPAMALSTSLGREDGLEEKGREEEEREGDERDLLTESSDGYAYFATGGFRDEEPAGGGWGLYEEQEPEEQGGRVGQASGSVAPEDYMEEEEEAEEEEDDWRGGSASAKSRRF